jgi:hypothetical protein
MKWSGSVSSDSELGSVCSVAGVFQTIHSLPVRLGIIKQDASGGSLSLRHGKNNGILFSFLTHCIIYYTHLHSNLAAVRGILFRSWSTTTTKPRRAIVAACVVERRDKPMLTSPSQEGDQL